MKMILEMFSNVFFRVPCIKVFPIMSRARGGGVLNNFFYGEAQRRGLTPYPFIRAFDIPFLTKTVPLSYTFY